jgi:alkanesulfonate monooxygenase SsuD/methylene tetrahydromethanopterin reductase-like flavin-dependent oxidoreductase (luciferase family)
MRPVMQIGMTLPTMVAGLDRQTILEWCRRIDAGPFSTLAAGERIAYPNQEMLTTLAAAAAVTERVRIATTIVVLPMHGTGLVAKQLATIDVLSGGRLGRRRCRWTRGGLPRPRKPRSRAAFAAWKSRWG